GRFLQPGLARRQLHIAGSLRPLELRGEGNADHGRKRTAVERIALNHDHRSAEPRLRPDRVAEVRPPYLALRDYHSERSSTRRAARWIAGSGSPPIAAHTLSKDSVTWSGEYLATNSATAREYS